MTKITSKRGEYEAELLPLKNGKEAMCRDCGEPIRFANSPAGKSVLPVSENDDGSFTVHFDVCGKAKVAETKVDSLDSEI